MEMATSKPRKDRSAKTPVESIRHKDKRKNIPTEEQRDAVLPEELSPKTVLYPRDPSLDPHVSEEAKRYGKITEILRVVDEIQTHSRPVIEHCYRDFLLQNHDPEGREYPDATDQIREVLIHANYLSQKDIEICLGFDIAGLADNPRHDSILALHNALVSQYRDSDE
jgi:hypothetical protein